MKSKIAGIAFLLIAAPAGAHDLWIQPQRFQVAPGAALPFTFQVGHGAARERWGNNDRILVLTEFFGNRRFDRKPALRPAGAADLLLRFGEPGLHVLGMQTNYAASELPAIRFNDYAKAEGLVPIIAARQRNGKSNAPGRERYSRRAKALIQVGPVTSGGSLLATKPIGMKLEIVPERDPYALGRSQTLPFYVLYKGRRLPNATVKLTNLNADERPVSVVTTDRLGRGRVMIPTAGNWLLNVVWSETVTRNRQADFDTTFSSLTFGSDLPPQR